MTDALIINTWYFLIYSCIGWGVEVVYCTVKNGIVINRGFLNGPVCPVYGFGMLLIINVFKEFGFTDVSEINAGIVFLVGMVIASFVELLAGWLLMKIFHTRWWDYSKRPFNIGGYICLQFSILWGLGTVMVIKIWHTLLESIVVNGIIPMAYTLWLLFILCLVYLADVVTTVSTIIGINKRLEKLDDLQNKLSEISEEWSGIIGQKALDADQKFDESRVQAALAKAELRDAIEEFRDMNDKEKEDYLKKQMEEMIQKMHEMKIFGMPRFLKAFPDMKHIRYKESFEKVKERLGKNR